MKKRRKRQMRLLMSRWQMRCKIGFFYSLMAPWRQCERCFIGPSVLYDGDEITLALGLFFLEVGIVLERKVNNESKK